MRKGFDGLCGLVQNEFAKDALSGDIFIFFNQRHTHIKLLQWQGDGFAMYYKRLEKGTYEIPEIECEKIGFNKISLNITAENILKFAPNKDILQLNVGGNPQFRILTIGLRMSL